MTTNNWSHRRSCRAGILAGLAVLVAALTHVTPAQTQPLGSGVLPQTASARSLYWGAYVGGAPYGRHDAPWDMRSADAFEANAGKRMSLLQWGLAWYDTNSSRPGLQPFPRALMDAARARGYIPVLNWGSYAARGPVVQPDFALKEIIRGRYDGFLREWATAAKAWGHPFFLRFDWEMNTNSTPYSETANGNSPGEFAAMWRHVHRIFTAVGARNVTWLWCPNVDYEGSIPVARLYPGHEYVDWVGLDGYNWGTNPNRPGSTWLSPDQVFRASYDRLTALAPGKPVMIAETASSEYGGSKASWIVDLLSRLPTHLYPDVGGVIWFNKNADAMDWVIESSYGSRMAFRAGIANRAYLANGFSTLSRSPVPRP